MFLAAGLREGAGCQEQSSWRDRFEEGTGLSKAWAGDGTWRGTGLPLATRGQIVPGQI